MNLVRKYCFAFLLFIGGNTIGSSQKFEVLTSTVDVRGLTEFGDQIVIYGNGLTWISATGEVQGKLNLIPGMSISSISFALADGTGGLWVLTGDALGYVNANREGQKIFDAASLSCSDGKSLKLMKNGTLYVLFKEKIIRVLPDKTYKVHFASDDKDVSYFQMFDVDTDGTLYIGSFKQMFVVEPGGKVIKVIDPGMNSIQDIQMTNDGKIFVLNYSSLFEYANEKLEVVVGNSHLGTGAKFYEGVFTSSNDYWLYSNDGNVFHQLNGKWVNFTPPAGMKTGNLGECMIQTGKGRIWMSLRNYPFIFNFDGSVWRKIEIQQPEINNDFISIYWAGDQLVSTTSSTYFPLQFTNNKFEPIPGLPQNKTYSITKGETGQWYWGTDEGIFTRKNNQNSKLVSVKEPRKFEVVGDELLYIDSAKICLFKNGQRTYFSQNEHFLGWDEISTYNLDIARTSDGKILITTGKRSGLISVYSQGQWQKVIDIQGKLIGGIDNFITFGENTYIFTNTGNIAVYANQEFKWIHFKPVSKVILRKSFVTPDEIIWYTDDNNILYKFNQSGLLNSVQLPVDKPANILNAVIPVGGDKYELYFQKTILQVDYSIN